MSIYKRICCTVVVCAIAATFSSCANSTDTGENTSGGVITIWAYDNYSAAAEKAVEIYKKDNPNCEYTFDVVNFGQDELVEKLKIALASDSVDLLPDLFYDEDYNFSEYVELHTDSFYNVSSYVADVPFYSYKTLNATYNDAYYAIPYDVCSAVMFYRTDLIHEAGYSDEDLNNITWDRYIEIGKDVKKKTGKDMLIMCPEGDMEGRIMYQSAGVWFYTNEGKPNMNSPAFRDAFTTMKKAYDEDIVYHSTSWDDYISAISNEKMVCLIGGSFWASILSEYTEQSGKWKITTIPRMTGNDSYTNYSNLSGGNWFVVNKDHSDFTAKFAAEMFAKNQELADFVGDQYLICPASEKLSSNTSSNGTYSFNNIEAGNYTMEIVDNSSRTEKYITTYVNIKVMGGKIITDQNGVVSTNLEKNQVRIVLTWGIKPNDLDSHMLSNNIGNIFHVYYGNKTHYDGEKLVCMLDLDDITSFGPETTTLYNPNVGVYQFYIHNYSGEYPLSKSNACVKVYLSGDSYPKYTFNVPEGSGRIWDVFCYNSATKTVTAINSIR